MTTTRSKKLAAVIAAVRQAAEEHPNRVYTPGEGVQWGACQYRPTKGNPSGCIIGKAMRDTGHSVDHVRAGSALSVVPAALSIDPERHDDSLQWLESVQARQDDGETWSRAVEYADKWEEAR